MHCNGSVLAQTISSRHHLRAIMVIHAGTWELAISTNLNNLGCDSLAGSAITYFQHPMHFLSHELLKIPARQMNVSNKIAFVDRQTKCYCNQTLLKLTSADLHASLLKGM